MLTLRQVLQDEGGFIHKRGSFFRKIGKKIVGGLPVVGGIVTGLGEGLGVFESEVDRFRKAREAGPGGARRLPQDGRMPTQLLARRLG